LPQNDETERGGGGGNLLPTKGGGDGTISWFSEGGLTRWRSNARPPPWGEGGKIRLHKGEKEKKKEEEVPYPVVGTKTAKTSIRREGRKERMDPDGKWPKFKGRSRRQKKGKRGGRNNEAKKKKQHFFPENSEVGGERKKKTTRKKGRSTKPYREKGRVLPAPPPAFEKEILMGTEKGRKKGSNLKKGRTYLPIVEKRKGESHEISFPRGERKRAPDVGGGKKEEKSRGMSNFGGDKKRFFEIKATVKSLRTKHRFLYLLRKGTPLADPKKKKRALKKGRGGLPPGTTVSFGEKRARPRPKKSRDEKEKRRREKTM